MIRATVTPHTDLEIVLGVRVPSEIVLPFAEWPTLDGSTIELPECTIARTAPPDAPTRKLFTKAPTASRFVIPDAPKVVDLGPPLAPRAFVEWLAGQLPDRGPVEATPRDHAAHARLVETYKARRATGRINPGSNIDVAWAIVAHNADLAVRLLGLDATTAAGLGLPPGEIARLQSAGTSRPALRDEILSDFEAEQALLRQEAERVDAARRRETEVLQVDLAKAGLIEATTDDPRLPFGRVRTYDAPQRRALMRSHGIPTGDTTLHLATREGDVATIRVRDVGMTGATRAELAAVGALDDAIVRALRQSRRPSKRYDASAFVGDARTVEGRHALQLLRARAAELVGQLAVAPANSAAGGYLMHLLFTLPAAYGGNVSLPNCVDAVQVALRDYVASQGRGRVYGRNGTVSDVASNDTAWPHGLPTPDTVPRAMLAELGHGSCWVWGEAYRPPSTDEERRLRAELDPALWERTIGAALADRAEVRSQDVYDALFAVALIASPTPNAEQRGRVSDLLTRAGYSRAQETDADGKRARVWRKAAPGSNPGGLQERTQEVG